MSAQPKTIRHDAHGLEVEKVVAHVPRWHTVPLGHRLVPSPHVIASHVPPPLQAMPNLPHVAAPAPPLPQGMWHVPCDAPLGTRHVVACVQAAYCISAAHGVVAGLGASAPHMDVLAQSMS